MRIGIDISQLAHKGGVAIYTQNLTEHLAKISGLDLVYFYSSLRIPYKGKLKNVKKYKLPPTLFEMLFNRWRNVSIEKFLGSLDIFHSSDWIQPPAKARKVTTYHDVVPLKYPNWSSPSIVNVHKRRLKIVEKEIDAVIAVSQTTKKDLIEVSNIDESKIKVIYEGPTKNFIKRKQEEIDNFRKKYNLPEKFILATGGIGERKNLKRIKEAAKGYNLVISGETIPWLDLDELELLYQSAKCLVYASLYEGFGLPLIDAFANGLPAITSNISSMPEIAGDAAFLTDPFSVESIKESIKEVMEEDKLRDSLIKKGFERAKFFSWEKAARETSEVYRKLVND